MKHDMNGVRAWGVLKTIVWAIIHLIFGIYMSYELNKTRDSSSPYKGLYIFSFVVMGINFVAFIIAAVCAKKCPAFLQAYEFVQQIGLFLLYALLLFTLNVFVHATAAAPAAVVAATTAAAATPAVVTKLIISDDSWYVLSTLLKLLLIYFGYSNALSQVAGCIFMFRQMDLPKSMVDYSDEL